MNAVNFDEFVQKMTDDGFQLAPWQQELAKSILEGKPLIPMQQRTQGKREAQVMACALAEIHGERWDVVGYSADQERAIRHEARELAARLTSGK